MSDRCRWVKLEADGRVLVCMCVDGHRPQFPQHFDKDFGEGSAWVSHDPCAWEADLCGTCEGTGDAWLVGGKHGDPGTHYGGCNHCDGSGLDLTVPLRLVGVGSVLRSPDGLLLLVTAQWKDRWVMGFTTAWERDIGPGKPWSVVRAVPPAYTGDTP